MSGPIQSMAGSPSAPRPLPRSLAVLIQHLDHGVVHYFGNSCSVVYRSAVQFFSDPAPRPLPRSLAVLIQHLDHGVVHYFGNSCSVLDRSAVQFYFYPAPRPLATSLVAYGQHLDHGVVRYVAASLNRFAVPVKTNTDQSLGSANDFPSQWPALVRILDPRIHLSSPQQFASGHAAVTCDRAEGYADDFAK